MLKIWYYANIEYMKDAPSYFDNVYEDEWIEDSFVKEMIQDVDHCTVISSHVIDSPILGAITPRELSGGVKVLILMLKDDSFIYNMSGIIGFPTTIFVDNAGNIVIKGTLSDEVEFAGGSGSENDPLIVSTPTQFRYINDLYTIGEQTFTDLHFSQNAGSLLDYPSLLPR